MPNLFWSPRHTSQQPGVNETLPISTKVGIGLSLACYFGAFTPLSLRVGTLGRLLTTDKMAAYVAAVILSAHVGRHGFRILGKVPGWFIGVLLLSSMAVSTLLADDVSSAAVSSGREVAYASLAVAQIILFRKPAVLRAFWSTLTYATVAIAVVAATGLVRTEAVLGTSTAAREVQEMVEGQAGFEEGVGTQGDSRESFLWWDANNFGYTLMPAVFFVMFGFLTEPFDARRWLIRTAMLGILAYNLVATASRGAVTSTASGVLLMLLLATRDRWTRSLVALMLVLLAGYSAYTFSAGSELAARLSHALDYYEYGDTASTVTGLETGRLIAAQLAYDEFIERPWFGWGGAGVIGAYRNTSNHLGHLNRLGHYGIVGFGLEVALLISTCWSLFGSTRAARFRRDGAAVFGYMLIAFVVAEIITGFFRTLTFIWVAGMVSGFSLAENSYHSLRAVGNGRSPAGTRWWPRVDAPIARAARARQ